jgi:hypothetical protein
MAIRSRLTQAEVEKYVADVYPPPVA